VSPALMPHPLIRGGVSGASSKGEWMVDGRSTVSRVEIEIECDEYDLC